MKKTFLSIVLGSVLLFSCKESKEQTALEEVVPAQEEIQKEPQNEFVAKIEKAHKKQEILKKENIELDFDVSFGGAKILDAHMVWSTDSGKGKITTEEGGNIWIEGQKVFTNIENFNAHQIRFNAYTWSYFILLPYKLGDKGVLFSALDSEDYISQKMVFEPGTGDAPEDWYKLYASKETHLLDNVAYIVTAMAANKEKAEEEPHAIVYKDYQMIDEIPVSHHWTFHNWSDEAGVEEQLGEANIKNVKFIEGEEDFFNIPENAEEVSI